MSAEDNIGRILSAKGEKELHDNKSGATTLLVMSGLKCTWATRWFIEVGIIIVIVIEREVVHVSKMVNRFASFLYFK